MRVALDLDGVLVNLTKGILRAHGCDPDLWPQVQTWEMVGECGLPTRQEDLWAPAARASFWAELEPTPWKDEILRYLTVPPTILSAPMGAHYGACCEGKRAWVEKHLGHDRLVLTDHKWLLAHPDCLLVDDSPEQYRRWRLHGGCAILWPANWNNQKARDPQEAIREVAALQNQ